MCGLAEPPHAKNPVIVLEQDHEPAALPRPSVFFDEVPQPTRSVEELKLVPGGGEEEERPPLLHSDNTDDDGSDPAMWRSARRHDDHEKHSK